MNVEIYEILYAVNDPLSPQQERNLLEFIEPYVSSVTYDTKTNRIRGFGIYRDKHFWYQLAVAYALDPDEETK